jgi:hypothetical protein
MITVFTLIKCGSNNEKNEDSENTNIAVQKFDSTDLPTEVINDLEGNNDFNLVYNFKEGESFSYRLTTLSNNGREIVVDSTMKSTFKQEITRIIRFNIISVENDSVAELKCTVTDIKLNATMDDQKFSYQSGNKLDSVDSKRFFEQEGMINNPFSIRITKHGELLDVFRADGIINKYLKLSGLSDSIDVQQKAAYQSDLVNNVLKPLVIQVFRELPLQNINVGSTWDKEFPAATIMVFRLGFTNHYKVTSLEQLKDEKVAVINGASTISVEGETKHNNNGINYEFEKPVSEASGKIYFNIDRGLVQKSKTKTRLEIKYTMEMPTPQEVKMGKTLETVTNDNILELL